MRPIEIDGRNLEGGGQLVRLTVGLAALTGQAVRLTNVRANRASKGRSNEGGGLKRQHLTAVKWLADACDAYTEGVELGSREFLFDPTTSPVRLFSLSRSCPAHDPYPLMKKQSPARKPKESKVTLPDGTVARQISVDLGSPGAITLVLQAILPFLIFSKPAWASPSDRQYPIHLTLEGGTHVTAAPTLCYVEQILIPNLHRLFPTDPPLISPSPKHPPKRGWILGSTALGQASFLIHPIQQDSTLSPFTLPARGPITKIQLSILAPSGPGRDELRTASLTAMRTAFPDITDITITHDNDSGQRFRYYILAVAETSCGTRIGRDRLFEGPRGYRWTQRTIAETLAASAAQQLTEEIECGHALDRRMMDQVVVFMGLAAGTSLLAPVVPGDAGVVDEAGDEKGKPSLHTLTARWAVEKMLGVGFRQDGACRGAGFVAGDCRLKHGVAEDDRGKTEDDLADRMAKLKADD